MNQRIVIKNFGPIKHVDLPIADYTLFIGPNASGKSTIAKWVYFCKLGMRSYVQSILRMGNIFEPQIFDSEKYFKISNSFYEVFWGDMPLQDDFEVNFYSDAQNVSEQKRIIRITKSTTKKNTIDFVVDKFQIRVLAEQMCNAEFQDKAKAIIPKDRLEIDYIQFAIYSAVIEWLEKIGFERESLFIPAGRQAFAIPKDERPTFSQDILMKTFYEHTIDQKKKFREPISQKIKGIKEGGFPERQVECLELAQDLTSKILKGEYVSSRDDERVYFDEDQYVKLYEASSGQQEALWILNSVYSSIEQNKQKRFTIIEEPEAHLYPETQKAITELISLLANQRGNQVMLTTHSPYILSALNNLLYAHKVGKTKPDEVAEVIDPLLWVDIDHVAAYKVENGTIRNIIDRRSPENPDGLDMIIPEEIDALPNDPIVEDYGKLFDLDDCHDAD